MKQATLYSSDLTKTFTSGTPTYLINMMRKFGVTYTDFAEGMEADASDFDAPTKIILRADAWLCPEFCAVFPL